MMYQQKELPPARAGCVFRRFCAYISDAGFLFEQHQPLNLIQSKKGNLRCGMFSPQTDCLEYFCHFLTILLLPQNGLYRARGVQVAALRFTFHFGRPNFPCSLQKNSCSNSKAFSYRRQCGPMSFLKSVQSKETFFTACLSACPPCLPHQPKNTSRLQCYWAHERHPLLSTVPLQSLYASRTLRSCPHG
jgi:hypothetical protein